MYLIFAFHIYKASDIVNLLVTLAFHISVNSRTIHTQVAGILQARNMAYKIICTLIDDTPFAAVYCRV